MTFFNQNLTNELNILKNKIQSLEAENRQLRKSYQNKMTTYVKTSHQLCPACFKKVTNSF